MKPNSVRRSRTHHRHSLSTSPGECRSGIGPLDGDTLDRLTRQRKVIPICPATARPIGTPLPSVRTLRLVPILPRSVGVLPTFFPPAGLWLSPHPSRATPSQCLAGRHMPRGPVPTRPRRRPPPSTLGNGDGQNSWNRCPSRSAPATGSPCGARKRWHPSLAEHRREADGTPKGAVCAGSKGTMRAHNSSGIRQSRRAFSWSSGISEAPMWKTFLSVGYHQIAY